MSDVAIEVQHVWKKFRRGEFHNSLRDVVPFMTKYLFGRGSKDHQLAKGDFWALKDIGFELKREEALGIIGPNGAGKSTMLKILTRILRPNRGQIHVHGRLSALIEVAAGFHPDLTGRENIYLNGAIIGMKKREIDKKFDEIIDFSGLEPFIDTPVKRYSSGMQARLGFSVMAHLQPEILLVDEVLSVGDEAFKAKCIRHMTDLIHSQASVIFISHNLDQVRQLCDRCIVLAQGEMRFIGDVDEACERYFEVLLNPEGQFNHRAKADISDGTGQLLGLTILDEKGLPTFKVPSHCPMTLEISYSLNHNVSHAGLAVNFFKADRTFLTTCSTMEAGIHVPAAPGTHAVRLTIEEIPFCGGDYLSGVVLLDVEGDRVIDRHIRRRMYPFTVEGPGRSNYMLHLNATWSGEGTPARGPQRGLECIT